MCGLVHYRDAETIVPVTFSKMHHAISSKNASKNDWQQHFTQVVETHGALNR
jgi:hypothetical protein